jgi:2-polyprenyl-3-methyl-5-hydroxy-6-metoxy-1,4-benzoquinol methylase
VVSDDERSGDGGSSTVPRKARGTVARVGAGVKRRLVDHRPGQLRAHLAVLGEQLDGLRSDQAAVADRLDALIRERSTERAEEEARQAELAATTRASRQSLDALASEMESVRSFGKVLSSSHGWPGAADAYEELIFILHDLRRSVRDLEQRVASVDAQTTSERDSDHSTAAQPAGSDPYIGRHPRRFDYLGFERRFRGSVEDVTRVLIERYADELESRGPVLDLGCGRGELLAELSRRGVEVVGVEPHEPTAKEARAKGLTVHVTTASEFLKKQPAGSFGAIVTLQVVEHLIVDDLIEMLELSAQALRPGGVFVAETPNPLTILTLHESYLLDPTHIQPVHPALLTFLTERAGFPRSEVRYHAPASTLWFDHVAADGDPQLAERLNQIIDRLNHQLYGPQDYAVWAYTPERVADAAEPDPATSTTSVLSNAPADEANSANDADTAPR